MNEIFVWLPCVRDVASISSPVKSKDFFLSLCNGVVCGCGVLRMCFCT